MSVVRAATSSDLDACVEIGGCSRARLVEALSDPGHVFLVAEWGGAPVGFLIGTPTGVIEEFAVEVPGLWPNVGQHLLREARMQLKARGVTQVLLRNGDAALLESEGFVRGPNGWMAAT
jgi:ribosomal protein S18 acetylase RimI-like enzyme